MLNTFWQTADGDLFIVEALASQLNNEEERTCILTDGNQRISYPESKLQEILDNEEGNGELKRVDPEATGFEFHAIMADADNERTARLYQTLLVNCMAITARRIAPFEEKEGAGNVKEHTTTLTDGLGFWRHAVPTLESNPDNEEQLVVKVILTGEIFKDRCRDPEVMEETQGIGDVYRVIPSMREVSKALDAQGVMVNNIDFDLQPMVVEEPEPEAASDEDYSLKS